MKNLTYFLILAPFFLQGQENCQGSFTEYYLNSNNIRASFFPRGNKYTDGNSGAFLAPYPSLSKLSTIFASSPWIAGFDDAGNFKAAVETYPLSQNFDFAVGPLNSIGVPYYDQCRYFDRAWSVFREDVLSHGEDYQQDFKIDDTIPSIFGWPGRGNKYFSRFNGFELPDTGNQGLAGFFDANGNNEYEPDKGDFPAIYISYISYDYIIPDQMMWMVFNDVESFIPSGNRPIRAEIQLTAFAFHCQDKEWLNNTIFNRYRIINRAVTPIDSLFFGMWTDYDLGCSADDFMGSDSARHTEFVYNADMMDGDSGPECSNGIPTYAAEPPVQSMTWLSHAMHSFIIQEFDSSVPLGKYNLLNGLWGDGTPIRPEGDGYNTNQALAPTRFLFNGDPRDPAGWAAINVFGDGKEQRSVSSASIGRLDPGQGRDVVTAHMFHYDPNADHLGQITHMYNNVDSLLAMRLHPHEPICTPVQTCMGNDCVWPGDFNRDGIVDHRDLLHWGTTTGMSGPARNGQISWRGHLGEDWTKTLDDGTNAKHQDADGNGTIDTLDLQLNLSHFLNKTQGYILNDRYPGGPELVIVSDPMDQDGDIGNLQVMSRRPLKDIYGMAFELEFDTFFYDYSTLLQRYPLDSQGVCFVGDEMIPYYNFFISQQTIHDTRYSYVGTSHENHAVEDSFYFLRIPFGLKQKHQLPLQYLPDQFVFRLKNLVAINKDGDDLDFGSVSYIVYNPFTTAVDQPELNEIKVFPNPCHDEVMIVSDFASDVEMVNVQGKKVRTIYASEQSFPVNIGDLVPGMYFLRFVQTQRMVKLVVQ